VHNSLVQYDEFLLRWLRLDEIRAAMPPFEDVCAHASPPWSWFYAQERFGQGESHPEF
jgi:hypothetical protein